MAADQSPVRKNLLWVLLVTTAILFGMVIRMVDLTDAPLDFHPTRQLHSAMIARGMYFQSLDTIPDWQKQMALNQWRAEGLIEPQIMERLTATVYQLIGSDYLWVARLWSILFWSIGGLFLFFLLKEISSSTAGTIAVAVYMFWPYMISASRSFQPESLMVAAIICSLWVILRWMKEQNYKWAMVAGLLCGFSIYIKSVAVFFLAPAVILMITNNFGIKSAVRNKQILIIAMLSILPYLIFHMYGVYGTGLLTGQFAYRFFPQRWIDPVFYVQWFGELDKIFNLWILIGALAGGLFLIRRKYFSIYLGILIGYFLYGMTFSYHITTHDYYHITIIIPFSIGVGLIAHAVLKKSRRFQNITLAIFTVSIIFLMIWNAWSARTLFKRIDYRLETDFWSDLGSKLGQTSRVIGIFPDYGYSLAYWGWINVTAWMTTGDMELREMSGQEIEIQSSTVRKIREFDYFIVADTDEFEKQPYLKRFLNKNFKSSQPRQGVLIYDLQS